MIFVHLYPQKENHFRLALGIVFLWFFGGLKFHSKMQPFVTNLPETCLWQLHFSQMKKSNSISWFRHFPTIVNCPFLPEHQTTLVAQFITATLILVCFSLKVLFCTLYGFSWFQSPPSVFIRWQDCSPHPKRTESPTGMRHVQRELHSSGCNSLLCD